MPKSSVKWVQPYEVGIYWPIAKPLLRPAVERFADEWTLDAVESSIRARETQLWIGYTDDRLDGAAVTQIQTYPAGKPCTVLFVGGSFQTLAHMPEIQKWAQASGCDRVWAYCRPGVARVLQREHGFREASRVMELKLWPVEQQERVRRAQAQVVPQVEPIGQSSSVPLFRLSADSKVRASSNSSP